MAVSKGSKKGKSGATKGGAAKSKKTGQPSQGEGKKEGTRMSTLGDLRDADAKKGVTGGSRSKLRDGSK